MPVTLSKARGLLCLGILSAVHGLIHTYSAFLSPLNTEIQPYFSTSIGTITSFKSAYLVVYAASNLVAGLLTNRVSPRIALAVGMTINASAVIGYGFVPADGVGAMYLLWVVAALGGGVYHPVANALITRLFPDRKGWAIGVSGIGAGLGFSLGPVVSGFAASAGADWRQIAVGFGFSGLLAGIAALYAIPPRRQTEGPPAASGAAGLATGTVGGGVSYLSGFLGVMTLVAGFRELATWTVLDIADFFVSVRGGGETALYLFLLYFPGVVVQPLLGHYSDRFNRNRLAAAAYLSYGIGLAALSQLSSPGFLGLAFLLFGIGHSGSVTVMEAMVADAANPRNRGLVFGVYITAGMGIGALGPLGFGALIDALGGGQEAFSLTFAVLAGLAAAGAVLLFLFPRVLKRLARLRPF